MHFLKKFPVPSFLLPKENANTYTSHLEDLHIEGCPALTCLQATDQISITLTRLEICNDFASFPKGGFPNSNFTLVIERCEKLEALPSEIHTLSSLEINDCPNMSLSEEGLPTKLSLLAIKSLKQYKALMQTGFHNFTSLTRLSIFGKPDGESLQEEDMTITLPRSLTMLSIEEFPKLKYLPLKDFEDLPCLDWLRIYDCPELTFLPSLPSSLLQLYISRCPLLKEACKRDKGKEWFKIADIPYVEIDYKFIYDPEEE
ncbi:hypothetical protein Ddye_027028 [Dipteronia dyeriana]|uniref:Uncharacterized protein n=1 Tax=Dipteronia dyeriana TaxID=168575 RepID=A0AAD9TP40_9ROSI|nr:hypothetical protein Ddye_027028 [Dipteronia dyeriana]